MLQYDTVLYDVVLYDMEYIHTYIHTSMHACMHACMHAYKHTYMHRCMSPSISPSLRPYIHTYIHTYVRTYVRTYMHIMYVYIYNICIYCNASLAEALRKAPRVVAKAFEFRVSSFCQAWGRRWRLGPFKAHLSTYSACSRVRRDSNVSQLFEGKPCGVQDTARDKPGSRTPWADSDAAPPSGRMAFGTGRFSFSGFVTEWIWGFWSWTLGSATRLGGTHRTGK